MTKRTEPIFIFGSARGGTTLLRLMLNMHSQIAIPPESHFLLHVLEKYEPETTLNKHEVSDVLKIIEKHPRFRFWNIDEKDWFHLKNDTPSPLLLSELIDELFRRQIKQTKKPVWGDKTPAYFAIVPKLKRLFPNSKMIVYTRDGRDVAISLKKRGWHGWSLYQRATYWSETVNKLYWLKGNHPAFFLTYEDLISHTETTLKALCEYLEIDFEDQLQDYNLDYKKNITHDEQRIEIHKKLARKPTENDKNRWKSESSIFDVWYFEAVAHEALKTAGYEVAYYRSHKTLHKVGRRLLLLWGNCIMIIYSGYSSPSVQWLKSKIKPYLGKKTAGQQSSAKKIKR